MSWNHIANPPPLAVIAASLFLVASGCRAGFERDEEHKTIVVRESTAPGTQIPAASAHDSGERHPGRIEVVVSDPGGGAQSGPSALIALVGRRVKVQFRRDLLGQSAAAPISPTGQGPGGRAVHLDGIVRSVADGWLMLDGEKRAYWIPQRSILLIEQLDGPTSTPAIER